MSAKKSDFGLIIKLLVALAIGAFLGRMANVQVMDAVASVKYALGQIIFYAVPLVIVGFITPAIAVGPFISYQTNLETIPRQTLDLGNGSALTVNQKHSVFQLPFGVTGRYTWLPDSVFQPYAGLKLGANYAEFSSYYYVIKQYTDTWGFYLSPEIGVSIFPDPGYRLGFHVSLYYSYATNSGDLLAYSVNNLNNFGVRVGISF